MGGAGFELVSQEQMGRKKRPHYFSTHAFTAWHVRDGLSGIFSTAPQTIADVKVADTLFRAMASRGVVRDLFIDTRGFGVEVAAFEHLILEARAWFKLTRDHVRNVAMVLPGDWSNSWWLGSMPLWVPSNVRVATFSDLTGGALWLEEPASFAQSLTALQETVRAEWQARGKLRTILRADPLMSIEQAARTLGLSARSLQRALQKGGETFAAIRDRVRAELAAALLTETDSKVDTVGSTVGFRSRSHFMSWFRRLTGHSPGAFRERKKARQVR